MKLGLLASGGLGATILNHLKEDYKIAFVLTDANSTAVIENCEQSNIPVFKGNPRAGRAKKFIGGNEIDVLVSVNYLFLIENDLISLPTKLAFNVHGSLLPKYRGRTPHVWAIINNEKTTGITAHIIDSGCDTGDILKQIEVKIETDDTGASILDKFHGLYPKFVSEVLQDVSKGTIERKVQGNNNATFFGKRTPEDGRINWNWQRERIYNWVRAQSSPYPGAFSKINNQTLIIDWVELSDCGYEWNMPNGKVVGFKGENPIVKTPNGCLVITKSRQPMNAIKLNDEFEN